jgi:MerR family transcriptional regulator, light-induced transcriptional regulator
VERESRDVPRHPMGVVAKRTGLTPHVLRAWERRYGAVVPGRTEGGQRLYSDGDVARLRLLKRATAGGRPIGSVASLPTEEVARLVGEDVEAEGVGNGGGGEVPGVVVGEDVERALSEGLAAAERLDGVGLRSELMRAVVKVGVWDFVMGVVWPLLVRTGELWAAGRLRPAQEHVVSAAVRQVLDWLLSGMDAGGEAPLLVLGTPEGEYHEFGSMLAGIVAVDAGWRVLYLGPSLPVPELVLAAERSGAWAVGVSVVQGDRGRTGRVREGLASLRASLPAEVSLLVGGRASRAVVPAGGVGIESLEALPGALAVVSAQGGGGA